MEVQLFAMSTVEELWRWGLQRELSDRKLAEAQNCMENLIIPRIGGRHFAQMKTEEINEMLHGILENEGESRAVAGRRWMIRLYQYAQENRLCRNNPAVDADRIYPVIRLVPAWTDEQMKSLISAMNELELGNLYKFQLYTGWSFEQEILGIRTDAMRLESMQVWLQGEKGAGRWGRLSGPARECLQDEIRKREARREQKIQEGKWKEDSTYLFTRCGRRLTAAGLHGDIQKIRDKSGVGDYGQTKSVQSAVVRAIQHGAKAKDLQLYFGQKPSRHILQYYRRLGG